MNRYGDADAYEEAMKSQFCTGDIDILIVCSKLLTGFDAPICQVLYIDKELKEHGLLQAIVRIQYYIQRLAKRTEKMVKVLPLLIVSKKYFHLFGVTGIFQACKQFRAVQGKGDFRGGISGKNAYHHGRLSRWKEHRNLPGIPEDFASAVHIPGYQWHHSNGFSHCGALSRKR